jgi:hypothetical protein
MKNKWEIPTATNFQQIDMALFTSFLTFDTSNYNYKHNVVLFINLIKDFIRAPCIYNIKNVVIILLKYVIYNTVNL